jgi:hypothetical protein
MDEQDENPPASRRKTLEEVREERRAERIVAVKDPAVKSELAERVRAREHDFSETREIQRQRRPEFVEDIRQQRRGSRLASVGTAEAEVTIQFDGWLRSLANRHNNAIDQKLDEQEEIHGKEFDRERFAKDELYRRVIEEEFGRASALQRPLGTQGPTSSLDADRQPGQQPQVAVDYARLASDPDYRNQILNSEMEMERSLKAPDLSNVDKLSLAAKPTQSLDSTGIAAGSERREAAKEILTRADGGRSNESGQQPNAGVDQQTTKTLEAQTSQSQKREKKIDWELYSKDESYRLQVNEQRKEQQQQLQQQQRPLTAQRHRGR